MNNFIWTDLVTLHVETAKDFYHELFGWIYFDASNYHMANVKGMEAAAIFQMSDKFKKLQLPSTWMPYLQVEGIDALVLEALKLGAKIDLLPFSFNDKGKIAVIKDLSGAHLTLCEGFSMNGLSTDREVGKLSWFDLKVKDPRQVMEFYKSLFDWQFQRENNKYLIIDASKEAFASITADGDNSEELIDQWIPTFLVLDLRASRQIVIDKGGEVLHSSSNSVLVKDVFGASFKMEQAI